jgi:hypothetical protein
MTLSEELKQLIEKEPLARERSNKNKVIAKVMFDKYGLEHNPLIKPKLADMVGEILNADRAWRKILEDNPELRGKDYSSKVELELEKQRELGYNV